MKEGLGGFLLNFNVWLGYENVSTSIQYRKSIRIPSKGVKTGGESF
jgi:hypothetical protein